MGEPQAPRVIDEQDIITLLGRMRPRIAPLLRSFRVSPTDAEDLIQEALLSLIRSWDRILDREAWFFMTLRYQCIGHLKRERGRAVAVDPETLQAMAVEHPDEYRRLELELDVEQLAQALPPRHRQLLRLRYVAGLSLREAAFSLGYRPGSVRRCISRSIRLLKKDADL